MANTTSSSYFTKLVIHQLVCLKNTWQSGHQSSVIASTHSCTIEINLSTVKKLQYCYYTLDLALPMGSVVLLIKKNSCVVGVTSGATGQAKGRDNQEAAKWIRNPAAIVWGGQTFPVRVCTQPNGPHSYSEVHPTLYVVTVVIIYSWGNELMNFSVATECVWGASQNSIIN